MAFWGVPILEMPIMLLFKLTLRMIMLSVVPECLVKINIEHTVNLQAKAVVYIVSKLPSFVIVSLTEPSSLLFCVVRLCTSMKSRVGYQWKFPDDGWLSRAISRKNITGLSCEMFGNATLR